MASTSPRRKEIFGKTRLPFEIQAGSYEEDMNLKMPPEQLVEYLARGKAESVVPDNPDAIIIAADTFVVCDGKCLGKPKTEREAEEMLQLLSGQEHFIITGVAIMDTKNGQAVSFHEKTKIFMKELSPETIKAYIKTGEPMDKAGAYALQELGSILIEKTEGDFFNAMGLPIKRLAEELAGFGIRVL